MWKILIRINKNLVSAIPVMMIAGFAFGAAMDAELVLTLKGLIVPLTFLMVYPMMVTPNIKRHHHGINHEESEWNNEAF